MDNHIYKVIAPSEYDDLLLGDQVFVTIRQYGNMKRAPAIITGHWPFTVKAFVPITSERFAIVTPVESRYQEPGVDVTLDEPPILEKRISLIADTPDGPIVVSENTRSANSGIVIQFPNSTEKYVEYVSNGSIG